MCSGEVRGGKEEAEQDEDEHGRKEDLDADRYKKEDLGADGYRKEKDEDLDTDGYGKEEDNINKCLLLKL